MAFSRGPVIVRDGLVLHYDAATTRSFRGEPTTNLSRNARDFSGTQYASSNEWTSPSTVLSKTYFPNLLTPIGVGSTLISESGNNGQHHLSRYGGGGEDGLQCLSCYIYPLTSDITNFTIGLLGDSANIIRFNLNTGTITYGGGISNRNAFIQPVDGWPGWLWVGANFEGRSGGWVGSLGYDVDFAYTGTSGAKSCYITGIQYENKIKPTFFTDAQTTRGTTVATGGGLIDLSGNNNSGELLGPTYNFSNKGGLVFDGTDDTIFIPNQNSINVSGNITLQAWVSRNSSSGGVIIHKEVQYTLLLNSNGTLTYADSSLWSYASFGEHGSIPANQFVHIVVVKSGSSVTIYANSSVVISKTFGSGISQTNNNLYIGSYNGGSDFFNGVISNVAIYNRALSASEILQNFNATRGRFRI